MPNEDGYRNNGLFGVDWYNEGDKTGKGSINDKFLYPPNTIRFLEAQDVLDGKVPETFPPYKMQRGYIRNLQQPALGEVPISRCTFQFNPQDIRQSVQMREDMYLAVLQDPAQLAQPIGAQMNFQFDLLFDRQMEVSRGIGGVDTGSGGATSADQIGVLADLKVFYEVIGQGLSEKMLASQTAALQAGATRVYGNSNPTDGTTNPDDGTTATTGTPFSAYDSASTTNANTFLNASLNSGNAAFLMPNPVRLLFSALFMLDGFVTATSVDFLKFSTKMVPVSCKVSVSMMAVYIGFARKDTFLTQQFAEAKRAEDTANEESAEGSVELLTALNTSCNKVTLGFTTPNDGDPDDINIALPTDKILKVKEGMLKRARTTTEGGPVNNNFIYMFNNIKPIQGEGRDIDEVLKLYEDDAQFTVKYEWTCRIYSKEGNLGWTTLDEALAVTAPYRVNHPTVTDTAGLVDFLSNLDSTDEIDLVAFYQGAAQASSKDEWGHGATSGPAGDWSLNPQKWIKLNSGTYHDKIRRLSITGNIGDGNPYLENNAAKAKSYSANGLGYDNGYYIVIWTTAVVGQVSGLLENIRPNVGSQVKDYYVRGDAPLKATYNLPWLDGTP